MEKIQRVGGSQVTFNMDGLLMLEREIKKNLFVKVGILSSGKASRVHDPKSGFTNVALGTIHEKGSKSRNIPRRSFLEMPLKVKGPDELKKNQKMLFAALQTGTVKFFLKRLGVVGENIVQAAFETGGFGSWAPLSKRTIARKHSSAILIDTAELRKSITSEPMVRG